MKWPTRRAKRFDQGVPTGHHRKTRTVVGLFLLLLPVCLAPAGAAEPGTEGAAEIPLAPEVAWSSDPSQVVITATRTELDSFEAPFTLNIVDLDGFRTQDLPRTTARALQDVPGIWVQKTSQAQGSPYIRGFTGFRTLMLVDGIRLNNSVFRNGPNQYWNLIDPYTVDRLEVVKGPSSVLYGSDAVGGTVNAVLRRPEGYTEGFNRQGRLRSRVSTAERSLVGRGELHATWGPDLGLLLGATGKDFGDVDGGGSVGPQNKTGYDVYSGDLRLDYFPDQDTAWTFAHYLLDEDDAWRPHKTVHGIGWEGTTVGNELERILFERRSLTYLRYAKQNGGGVVDSLVLTSSFQTLEERRERAKNDMSSDRQGVDVETCGLGVQFESPGSLGRWTYGLEWYHDRVDSFATKFNPDGSLKKREIQGPVGDDARYDLLGLYLQNSVPVSDRLELILGGRYNYARADADEVKDPDTGNEISVTEDWGTVVGSARASWFVDGPRHWNVFGGVSQGFRAPNLSDLTRLDTARSNEIETPSPGLDPEYFLSYEAGVKARFDRFSTQVAYHYTDIEDMIVRTPTGDVIGGDNEVTKKNAGDGYVHGMEVEASYRFRPEWTVFGSVSWMYGEVETFPTSAPVTKSEPIDRLMPPVGQVGVRWDHRNDPMWVEAVLTTAGDADHLSTRDRADTQRIPPGGTPGYTTVDLRGGWRIRENLDVWAGLENLTNEDYRIHGSGVNEPGFNVKLGLNWRF